MTLIDISIYKINTVILYISLLGHLLQCDVWYVIEHFLICARSQKLNSLTVQLRRIAQSYSGQTFRST